MVVVAQLVRASDCGSECRGFESRLPPLNVCLTFSLVVSELPSARIGLTTISCDDRFVGDHDVVIQ
jgi:hypothetical protein